MRRLATIVVAMTIAVAALAAPASAAVITNGGFETGTFQGWIHRHSEGGSWNIADEPLTGCADVYNSIPMVGAYSAVANMGAESRMALLQRFKVPEAGRPELTMNFSYESGALFVTPDSLSIDAANQQVRVDLLRADARTWSVKPADVLEMVFRTEVGDSNDNFVQIEQKLRPFRGKTVKLRIAIATTQECLPVALDSVRVTT